MDIATEFGQRLGLLECKNSGCADCLSINSFSKYFSMTGWRLGWMVVLDGAFYAWADCSAWMTAWRLDSS
ncbi:MULTISPECIES: aminotransferase class I/II-fold pyridoxal phosphate-dependent enzyme [Shewanella]|uniref:aminotransferase class I/II-fold pyridoxal phosphate-dependent enzyme n=1 Tax=Shewanella TaxID=22 RepID=UPI00311FE42E